MNRSEWMDAAYIRLRQIARGMRRRDARPMTVEAIRSHMEVFLTINPPGDLRWFGPVVQRAIREGVLIGSGWRPAKSSHGAIKRTYYGGKNA